MPGGVFSVFENLVRGFGELIAEPSPGMDFNVTVFHGGVRPAHFDNRLRWQRVSDAGGRFIAETRLGLNPGRPLDSLLFLNYYTPPIVRAKRL